MDKKLAFQILGIAETKEEDKIRQTYLSLLKETNPEDDPEGFKRLREAYEAALRFASERGDKEQEQEPQDEVEIWMKRVRETYRDIFLRNDAEVWKELFEEPVCIAFDTFLDARSRLLAFLSGHSFLPRAVWQQMDRVFHVLDDFDALREEFHVNFLRHIEYHVNTDDFLDYSRFEAKEDYGPEDDEEIDHYIIEFFEIRNKLEEGATEGVEQTLADITRHGLYHPYEEVERLRLYIRLGESEKGSELAESLLSRYPGDSYVQIWTGKIFSDAGDEERGFALWEAVLEKEPAYYMARYFALGYLMRQKKWFQARKYVNELLKVYSQDEELRADLDEINTELVPMVQEAYEKGEGFEDIEKEDISLFLGRSLYNMERFDEVMALLEKDPELSKKGEDALNLKTWTLYRLERYEEAIPVFGEYQKCLEEIADEEERTSKMAQVHRMLGSCYFCLENREEGERETRTAIEMEKDERSRLDYKYYLADKYLSFMEYERAVEECDEILAADENYYPAYLVRQEACYRLKRGQQVVDDYYRAIEIYPGYDKPYLFAAMIFYNYSQYKDAMGVIEKARENKVEFSQKLCFQEAKIRRMLAEREEERQEVMELLDALLYATEGEGGQPRQDDDARPDDTLDRAELIFEKALVFEDDDKLLDAVALVREALKLDPKEPYYHLVLGNLLRDMQNYTAALKEYELVEENYDHAEFYFGIGVCHEEAKNWAKAICYYEKAVEKDEYYRDTNHRLYRGYLNRFKKTWKKADYDAALHYINKQLEITENKAYRLWDRAYLYSDGMEHEKSLADYREVLEGVDRGDRYIILQNIGYIYKDDRQFVKAYQAFRQAVEEMEKKDASAKGYWGMAECMKRAGDYGKAIESCRAGLAVFPNDEELWGILVDCYKETGRFEEALSAGEEWHAQTGDTTEYYRHVAFVLLKMDRVKEALATMEKGKRALLKKSVDKEELGHFHQKWADILAEMNDYAGSAEKYLDAAALQTGGMKRFQDYWRAGRSFYMTGRREEASKYAGMALKILAEEGTTPEDYMSHPNYAPIRMGWMGWIELALGNKEKAKQYFEKMEQINPCGGCRYRKCFEASLHLGFFYYSEGEFDKAAELLEEAFRRNEDALDAKFLLEKMRGRNGSDRKSDDRTRTKEEGQQRNFVARLFHKEPKK